MKRFLIAGAAMIVAGLGIYSIRAISKKINGNDDVVVVKEEAEKEEEVKEEPQAEVVEPEIIPEIEDKTDTNTDNTNNNNN